MENKTKLHDEICKKLNEKLQAEGYNPRLYRSVPRGWAPGRSFSHRIPDVTAIKKDEFVIIEVKTFLEDSSNSWSSSFLKGVGQLLFHKYVIEDFESNTRIKLGIKKYRLILAIPSHFSKKLREIDQKFLKSYGIEVMLID